MLELLESAKILPVGILQQAGNDRFITLIVNMFQIMQSHNQARGQSRSSLVLNKQNAIRFIKSFPIYLIGQNIQLMFLVEYLFQAKRNRSPCDSSKLISFGCINLPVFDYLSTISGNYSTLNYINKEILSMRYDFFRDD